MGIHEVGEIGGALYFVMEYVHGGDLASFIAQHDAKAWHTHALGIVHRDFKPSND